MHFNFEIKARCSNPNDIREILKSKNAIFIGTDYQIDTYFRANNGRLKLREGNIENYLIYYDRQNSAGPKKSKVILFETEKGSSLKEILTETLGILIIVEKKREIYRIHNIKFHIDLVENLGPFLEIEAIDKEGTIGEDKLQEQCNYYLELLRIPQKDLISVSYSDLLLRS